MVWFIAFVMALGTIVLIIAEFTPFFAIISYPFGYILNWLQIPYALKQHRQQFQILRTLLSQLYS
jgi:nucleoside recognition membrane protein YjiH